MDARRPNTPLQVKHEQRESCDGNCFYGDLRSFVCGNGSLSPLRRFQGTVAAVLKDMWQYTTDGKVWLPPNICYRFCPKRYRENKPNKCILPLQHRGDCYYAHQPPQPASTPWWARTEWIITQGRYGRQLWPPLHCDPWPFWRRQKWLPLLWKQKLELQRRASRVQHTPLQR